MERAGGEAAGEAEGKPAARRRRYVRFTRWRRAHFFRMLEETGHAQMAAAAAGVSLGCVYRLRRVEPGFADRMAAAVAEAGRRLAQARRPGDGQSGAEPPSPALVICKGRGGRLRLVAAGPRWWTERHDALFLGHLRATGNVAASAQATGFTAKTVYNRRDRLPGFAAAMDEALEAADLELLFRLAAHASGKTVDEFAGPEAGFDPEQAMRALTFRDNRRLGAHAPRRRPPPTIEAVSEKIVRVVRAIERKDGRGPPSR